MSAHLADVPPTSFTARGFLYRNHLVVFFILVLVLTWPLQIVDALGSHGLLPVRVPVILQVLFVAYMPTTAALIMAALMEGKQGVLSLLKKLLIWRVGVRWYAVAIGAFGLFCGASVFISNVVAGQPGATLLGDDAAKAGSLLLVMAPAVFLVTTLVNGEELAWRGYALPRLQRCWSALSSSLILGFMWILFHVPMWLTLRTYPVDGVAILSWALQLLGASVIFTWLFNNTRGSVLLAYLLHGSVNTWTRIFALDSGSALAGWVLTALVCGAALALTLFLGADNLRRSGERLRQ